jgi:class 3 adenylate cyclase
VILFNKEPEFTSFDLDVRMDKNNHLTLIHPHDAQRKVVGKKVLLEPELINGHKVFLGKYVEFPKGSPSGVGDKWEAVLISETIRVDNRIIIKEGEIYKAPYFILDVTYDKLSLMSRVSQVFKGFRNPEGNGKDLIEVIDRLRENIEEKNRSYHELEKTNAKLTKAKTRLLEYAGTLEEKVEERTAELSKAKEDLLIFNEGLKTKVEEQVEELNRYNELRRYLSPKLTEKILSSGDTLGAEPQRKMMTVLFSDIRNFSALTDSLEPEEIFKLLDRYLSEMIRLIHRYEGTLNKIVGDGLLIFFGDPIPMDDHAQRAVKLAIDMQKNVAESRVEWLQYGHELTIGIGINTGYMSVGNVGSETHRDYTVIGNQVNVAARLESLAKPGQILISQRTYSRVQDLVKVDNCGQIPVKGLHHPIETYNVQRLNR